MTDCIFCKIIKGELPGDFVYKNDSVAVFKSIKPSAPIHLLVVPQINRHIGSINDLEEGDRAIVSELFLVAKKVAKDFNLDQTGYKLVFNVGRGGGQLIDHLHLHLLGGWKNVEASRKNMP
ncbi:HIT domain-containing protein [Candidatus Azambacteria bacterium]|nr:HIT domain-containing protein [Candidatus Azambacteria bacterium]